MKPKQTKTERIAELERKLRETESYQTHRLHYASIEIDKTSTDRLFGSGVVLSLTLHGGKEVFKPVLIRDGLSNETIAAIKADLVRSYEKATEFKLGELV